MADGRAGTFSGCCYGSRVQWSSKGIISHRIRDELRADRNPVEPGKCAGAFLCLWRCRDHDTGSDGCCPKTEKGVDMSGREITADLYSSPSDQRSDGSGWILSCCDLTQPHDGRVCYGVFCSSCRMLKRTQDHEALSLCPGCARKNISSYWSEPFLKVPYFFNSLSASANFLE